MTDTTILVSVLTGIITSGLLAMVIYFTNNKQPAKIDWRNVAAYGIFGAILGGVAGYYGVPVTMEWVGAQILIYGAIIVAIDQVLVRVFPTNVQSFMIKYTGHNYFPEFILNLKNGTEQRFNNSQSGICCSIWVMMQGVVTQMQMIRSQAWYPGFTVTPAFLQGTSPFTFALNVVTGMDSDGTPLKEMWIDWKDGSDVQVVQLSLNKDGNPSANVQHTYIFNGN